MRPTSNWEWSWQWHCQDTSEDSKSKLWLYTLICEQYKAVMHVRHSHYMDQKDEYCAHTLPATTFFPGKMWLKRLPKRRPFPSYLCPVLQTENITCHKRETLIFYQENTTFFPGERHRKRLPFSVPFPTHKASYYLQENTICLRVE